MNLLEIATHVCTKINKPELLTVCKTLATRNYELIYDSVNWRDVEFVYTDTLPASTQALALNVGASRAASVRAAGKLLDPVNAVLLAQIDPEIFERQGEPEFYEEYFDTSTQTHTLKFYPIPAVSTALLIVAIRKISAMSADSDVSAIRNIDNTLIAFTEADLLERVKQYGMASDKRKEAVAMLQAAQELDQQQRSNIPRQIKPMSVTGDTMAELLDATSSVTSKWSPEDRVLMREGLRRSLVTVWDSMLWRESQFSKTFTSQFGGLIIMPPDVALVLAMAREGQTNMLQYSDLSRYFQFDPNMLTNIGEPVTFTVLTPVAVDAFSTQAEALSIVSSDAQDLGRVFIRGQESGVTKEEYVTLNGTTPVVTTETYDRPLVLSKKKSVGTITVTGNVTNTVMVVLKPDETGRQNVLISLNPNFVDPATEDETISLVALGKRTLHPFVQDEDRPMLSGIGGILINMTAARIFRKYGDAANADMHAKLAATELQNKISKEREQSANASVVVPYAEGYPLDFDVFW